MEQVLHDKKTLRAVMKKRRTALSPLEAEEASQKAQEALLESDLWNKASRIALYAAAKGETGTSLLLAEALAQHKAVFFPRVRSGAQGLMDFVQINCPQDLVEGAFGIRAPRAELPGLSAGHFVCELAVIPGLAFSSRGQRLGFGGGFYDRFFTESPVQIRIGFCYSFQVVTALQTDPWDVTMTHLCSDKGFAAVDP